MAGWGGCSEVWARWPPGRSHKIAALWIIRCRYGRRCCHNGSLPAWHNAGRRTGCDGCHRFATVPRLAVAGSGPFATDLGNKPDGVLNRFGNTAEQIANLALFSNVQPAGYWSGTQYAPNPVLA